MTKKTKAHHHHHRVNCLVKRACLSTQVNWADKDLAQVAATFSSSPPLPPPPHHHHYHHPRANLKRLQVAHLTRPPAKSFRARLCVCNYGPVAVSVALFDDKNVTLPIVEALSLALSWRQISINSRARRHEEHINSTN